MTYAAYTMTSNAPTEEFAMAEISRCDDVGPAASGSEGHRGTQSESVQTWTFTGHDPGDLLAVRVADSWQVFIADSVPDDDLVDSVP
ncbi:hypothetical protein FXB39_09830 [Nocardioides sp. BGMRC 2183]|nr:hypothetical protein FXB39_09830 [Nocardioides sp. BGMRC 2183]